MKAESDRKLPATARRDGGGRSAQPPFRVLWWMKGQDPQNGGYQRLKSALASSPDLELRNVAAWRRVLHRQVEPGLEKARRQWQQWLLQADAQAAMLASWSGSGHLVLRMIMDEGGALEGGSPSLALEFSLPPEPLAEEALLVQAWVLAALSSAQETGWKWLDQARRELVRRLQGAAGEGGPGYRLHMARAILVTRLAMTGAEQPTGLRKAG